MAKYLPTGETAIERTKTPDDWNMVKEFCNDIEMVRAKELQWLVFCGNADKVTQRVSRLIDLVCTKWPNQRDALYV